MFGMQVNREQRVQEIQRNLQTFRVVGLLGARQVGKTTLARDVATRFKGRATLNSAASTARRLLPIAGKGCGPEAGSRPRFWPVPMLQASNGDAR